MARRKIPTINLIIKNKMKKNNKISLNNQNNNPII